MSYNFDPVVLRVMRSQINPSDEPFVDDLSLAIRAPKAVVNQAGIIVKTPDKRDIHIQIDDITTVIQLKLRIERETGIAEDSQRLIVGAKQLVDSKFFMFEKKVTMLTYPQRHYSEQQWC